MVRIEVRYEGELHCVATHAPSGAELVTDAPADNHGRGEAFSPTDLVASSIGTCMLTIMGIAAAKRGWDIAGSSASVEKEMIADPARRIRRLTVEIRVAGRHDAEARRVLEAAGRGCPVTRSLGPGVEVPVTFRWEETA